MCIILLQFVSCRHANNSCCASFTYAAAAAAVAKNSDHVNLTAAEISVNSLGVKSLHYAHLTAAAAAAGMAGAQC